jgi:hypothetical protein
MKTSSVGPTNEKPASKGVDAAASGSDGPKLKLPELASEHSLLANYVSDEKDDGTYTLNLNEAQTRELWEKIDRQTVALMALLMVFDPGDAEIDGYGWGEIDAIINARRALARQNTEVSQRGQ